MDTAAPGEYIALVVHLQADRDGTWQLSVDGTTTVEALPLKPLALVIRLWRTTDTGILRGNIRLFENNQWVPIQSNTQLEQLIRAWLLPGGAAAAGK